MGLWMAEPFLGEDGRSMTRCRGRQRYRPGHQEAIFQGSKRIPPEAAGMSLAWNVVIRSCSFHSRYQVCGSKPSEPRWPKIILQAFKPQRTQEAQELYEARTTCHGWHHEPTATRAKARYCMSCAWYNESILAGQMANSNISQDHQLLIMMTVVRVNTDLMMHQRHWHDHGEGAGFRGEMAQW